MFTPDKGLAIQTPSIAAVTPLCNSNQDEKSSRSQTVYYHSRRLKHTSSLPKYHFTVQSSPVKYWDVDQRHEGDFGGPLRRERGRSRHAHAYKLRERGHNLRPGGQGSPNGRCCFSGGGSNICLGDSNWRERHSSCPFRSDSLSPDGGRPLPCRGRP